VDGVAEDKPIEKPIKINHAFREQLGLVLEGDGVSYCYQCGACVGDCPSARFSDKFNPRNIMLAVLYGMEDEVVGPNSPVWMCSNCFTCFDRCPQDVKPVEVITALKNLMAERGIVPEGVDGLTMGVLRTGRSVLVTPLIERRRAELGLPPLPEVPVNELHQIVEEKTLEGVTDGAKAGVSRTSSKAKAGGKAASARERAEANQPPKEGAKAKTASKAGAKKKAGAKPKRTSGGQP
jgi:heterodisulfide reductase subunit C